MHHKIFNFQSSIFNYERGATTILMAFFVMSILLMISLSAAGIMIYQIQMARDLANSIPAFYAADAGAEKCLYQNWKLPKNSGDDCTKTNQEITINLENKAIGYAKVKPTNALEAWGVFGSIQRRVELKW